MPIDPGGPVALVTNRCLFRFCNGRFALASVHPGHTVEEVVENTGFNFEMPAHRSGNPVALARNAQTSPRGDRATTGRRSIRNSQRRFSASLTLKVLSHAEKPRSSCRYTRKLVCRPHGHPAASLTRNGRRKKSGENG